MIESILILLLAFQFKHWLCDYPLQTPYMLRKGGETHWFLPLVAHASTHAVGTLLLLLLITNVYVSSVVGLAVLDFIIHFSMDRIKAAPHLLGRFKPDKPYFWWALGFDQMIHHLTHYLIILIAIGYL